MWVHAIPPALLLAAALYIALGAWRAARWPRAIGTVRSVAPAPDDEGWVVTLAFEEPGGWTSEAILNVSERAPFQPGQPLDVRRNPLDPRQVELLHPRRITAVLAVLLLVAAAWIAAMILG